ncbi:MAG: PEP-CTERM sorting domain-containing protein [Richelia sp. RM2_1_2]|nr:PEP-CTERM sorting domain-containing protein [Richelia sp. SM2_1_7]NJM23424.1 PEP-CTERM sorting domain-containing protein [Richelia sp. SM1_7_0]NJN13498.1 PEP-CTERM sorting domain-containing protein [Richelia sp. RM1_1_1]NJO31514.1 PEP-CTERM sorting domain-containing protein [Richelia sp. SL_2_1]NJO65219.1 PEP-CTERM sorting domain-containing protein [Richelia sp. RM2_1_2]
MKLKSFFNITVFPFAVAALSVIGFPNQAKAILFSGSVGGTWGEPTPGKINTDSISTGVGTNTFTWGDPTLFQNAFANQLLFEGNSFSTDSNSLFKIGDLTYHNGTVLLGTGVESVPLNLNLSFDQPTKLNQEFKYEFYLENTPNLSEDPELNADFVFVTKDSAKPTFVYDGHTYTLSLTGFSQDNGKTNVSEFRVLEGEKTTAAIFAQINKVSPSKKVPEPGFAVGLSLVGIYLISRKKVSKIN